MHSPTDVHPLIADYDADNYDYRTHWHKRAYEQWAESFALERLLVRLRQADWLIDFGGGFGRNTIHYCQRTSHAVLVDYSLGNLQRAATTYAAQIERGQLFLIRADLYHLPFMDQAFDVGLMVRVLHHLTQVDNALKETGRVVSQQWLLDVPIKHHVFARLCALAQGEWHELSSWDPKMVGSGETPFANFHLAQIRRLLAEDQWDSRVVASVNNFRRWDQRLPAWMVALLKPQIYGLELLAQRVGKGWWGPSQFLWARRREPGVAQARAMAPPAALGDQPWALLAVKMSCPLCRGPLHWSASAAHCEPCARRYPQTGLIWDFVPQ